MQKNNIYVTLKEINKNNFFQINKNMIKDKEIKVIDKSVVDNKVFDYDFIDIIDTAFWNIKDVFVKTIKLYYLNNQQISKFWPSRKINKRNDLDKNKDMAELLIFNKDINIIEYWDDADNVFIFILKEGKILVNNIMWCDNQNLNINEEDSIFWEMTLYNDYATANVTWIKWTKLLKIPKKDFYNILWEVADTDAIKIDLKSRKIISDYVKQFSKYRNNYNISILAGLIK